MKYFVTGACGQLGNDVVNELRKRNHEVVGSDVSFPERLQVNVRKLDIETPLQSFCKLDITNPNETMKAILNVSPDVIVHCAAWTAVDAAEEEENRSKVYDVNVKGTKNIVEAAKRLNCKLIYISTDYVFDGKGEEPWEPDCKKYAPLNYYGKTKLEGELAVSENLNKYFVVRIAWVFGQNGNNFVKTMLNAGKKYDTLTVVNDQIGTPTYTYDLARLLVDMSETEKYGFYHATNEGGYISWYDFASEIFRQAGYETVVKPVSTEEYGISKAIRPFNSRLEKSKLISEGFDPLPDWKDALNRYLKSEE